MDLLHRSIFRYFIVIIFKIGPDNWGTLCEEWGIASTGHCQSPIDLTEAVEGEFDPLEFTIAYFDEVEGHLFNNGHTGKYC